MANYEPIFRSNYFAVKDEAKFKEFCNRFNLTLITKDGDEKLFGCMNECGGMPSDVETDTGDYEEANFIKELSQQLADGHVAIVQEIGFEKMRYFVGYSIAMNSKGKTRDISIDAIYKRAKKLGEHMTEVMY
jgi:hypothetical protein